MFKPQILFKYIPTYQHLSIFNPTHLHSYDLWNQRDKNIHKSLKTQYNSPRSDKGLENIWGEWKLKKYKMRLKYFLNISIIDYTI